MADGSDPSRLTAAESEDLNSRVERFQGAWKPNGTTRVAAYLPPPGTRHRSRVLVRLIESDMERRAAAGLPFRIDRYVTDFPDDLRRDRIPVALLATEYRLRLLSTGQPPPLTEYQHLYPDQFGALQRYLGPSGTAAPTGAGSSTTPGIPRAATSTKAPGSGTVPDGRVLGPAGGAEPQPPPENVRTTHAPAPVALLPANVPYQLVRKLGSGGYGEVFEALAEGGVRVAIKIIAGTVDDLARQSEEKALEEIKQLAHPFLLKMNAYWSYPDRLVIVMDLADCTLSDRIKHHEKHGRTGIPVDELVPLIEQTAEALDYVHSKDVSHRDVKPENILILGRYAKIGDFSLARKHANLLTAHPSCTGSLPYMSPEVCNGHVDLHKSDQYSLAATYVRARTGRYIFPGKSGMGFALAHLQEAPDLGPLPREEQAVILKALAKNPAARFPSCSAFARALRAAVFPPLEEERKFGLVRAAAVALGAALVCGLALVLIFSRSDKPLPPYPEQPGPPVTSGSDDKSVGVKPPLGKPGVQFEGWTPVDTADVETSGDKQYPRRLTRRVGDEELVAILVFSKRPADPQPFYVLENKVTNRVFQRVWAGERRDPASRISQIVDRSPDLTDENRRNALQGGNGKPILPIDWKGPVEWRNAIRALDGKPIEIDPGAPVLGVTVPEAMLVAEYLGGHLPTYRQWRKAVGALAGDDKRDGPAGKALPQVSTNDMRLDSGEKRKILAERNLALGLEGGPWPVARRTSDESVFKIHQLISNGAEWVDVEPNNGKRLLVEGNNKDTNAGVVGEGPHDLYIWTFRVDMPPECRRLEQWIKVQDVEAGFRIVLEP